MQLLEEYKNLERCTCIEITGCLIRQNHRRVIHQCTSYGYALHLSTRHLVRLMIQSFAQSYCLQCLYCTLFALLGANFSVVHQRQLNVFNACSLRQKVVVLEYESNLTVAQYGALRLRHLPDRYSIKVVFARTGCVEASELIKKRRLARTRFTHDCDEFAFVYLERHSAQRMYSLIAYDEVALYVVEFYYYFLFVHIYVIMYRNEAPPPCPSRVGRGVVSFCI